MARRKREKAYTPRHYWDGKWRLLDFHGRQIIFFYRPALAKALNRSTVAIRNWESQGVLCHPRLRDPKFPNPWLYTESQILDLIALAEEERILDPNYRRPITERFKKEAWVILQRLPGEEQ
jgi:hypothetical protein